MRTFLTVSAFVLYVIVSFPAALIALIIKLINHEAGTRFSYGFINGGMRFILWAAGTKITIYGRENLPGPDTPALYVANHRSYFDIVITHFLVPNPTCYIAKKEVTKVLPLKIWLALSDALPIDRKDVRQGLKVIHKATDYVESGHSVFVFPEGTRSHEEGKTAEFKNGTFKIATRTRCPIVPISIIGSGTILEDNHKLKISKVPVTIIIGKPVQIDDLTSEEQSDLGATIRQIVVDNYEHYRNA